MCDVVFMPIKGISVTSSKLCAFSFSYLAAKIVYIVTVYRPPRDLLPMSDFIYCLESGLESLHRSTSSTVCLVGDFNSKNSSWWGGQATNEPGEALFNFAVANGFAQLVDCPTHDVGGPAQS